MITRFAPSPTGPLHLGHAYSALYAFDLAAKKGGKFLLRIEDIDQSRSRSTWEERVYSDLEWLGISWEQPVYRQSERLPFYREALRVLEKSGVLYNCTCNRRDILEAANAPQEGAPHAGPDGIIYPGTCRIGNVGKPIQYDLPIRLNVSAAFEIVGHSIFWQDNGIKTITKNEFLKSIGDVVLARKDMGTSYHLSVVVDDADQGITDVVRGEDLAEATAIHVLLQHLLRLPSPNYHHHRLIRDNVGKRLSKRDDARAIALYRDAGLTPRDIRQMVGLPEAS